MTQFRIAPSILSADFARLGEEVRNVVAAGADWIHFDVMDNHYVPNLTIGPMVCEALRPHVSVPIDVHLMVRRSTASCRTSPRPAPTCISFHPEASGAHRPHARADPRARLQGRAWCSIRPRRSTTSTHVMDKLDLVLIMSVNPGFGGQTFIPEALRQAARGARAHRRVRTPAARSGWRSTAA